MPRRGLEVVLVGQPVTVAEVRNDVAPDRRSWGRRERRESISYSEALDSGDAHMGSGVWVRTAEARGREVDPAVAPLCTSIQ
jgi:hypothetical protein